MSTDTGQLTPQALEGFTKGTETGAYRLLGAHAAKEGTRFAVWAPNATAVSVVGSFNDWREGAHLLEPVASTGVFAGTVKSAGPGDLYKYAVRSRLVDGVLEKADPFAFASESPPQTASVVHALDFTWNDVAWMASRRDKSDLAAPMAIYEVHLGSFMRPGGQLPSYRELAPALIEHAARCGFTHVEFLPVMEHPFYGSWGYETTGYFAPTARYGTPQDFMALIDALHQAGIGVILDWVPAHFPEDAYGLAEFDGSFLYEHADPRKGFHPDWKTRLFNYGRHEVQSFLLSSAHFWCDLYHADGIRVDAVASMLYLDYSRKEGEWIPNRYGGRENLEAIDLLKALNATLYERHPGVQTIAEESTSWPMVSRPTYVGGLGFGYKWDMGFMHDTLTYFAKDPIHRQYHHDLLTFRSLYAFSENFVLPFSHDEVVHGKGSLLSKMPGDDWQKFANLRLLLAYMYGQPGKKLLFMGDEFGQWREWSHERSLDWDLLEDARHLGLLRLVGDLNGLYRRHSALHRGDSASEGISWIDTQDNRQNVLAFLRAGAHDQPVCIVCHFSPSVLHGYRVGVPAGGFWRECLNTDSAAYEGSGQGNLGGLEAEAVPWHGRPFSLTLTLPPLAAVWFTPEGRP